MKQLNFSIENSTYDDLERIARQYSMTCPELCCNILTSVANGHTKITVPPKYNLAILPRGYELLKYRLIDMEDGDYKYTSPWVMVVDKDGELWLKNHMSLPLCDDFGGAATMGIGKRGGKYFVNISRCDKHEWVKGEKEECEKYYQLLPVFYCITD